MIAKILLLSLLLTVNPITFIANRNYYASEAERAFNKQNYTLARQHYAHIIQQLEWKKDNIYLNLAHAYFLEKKYALASIQYGLSAQSPDAIIASVALNQLGYLASMNQDFEKSLQYFQEAVMKYPQNDEARYNYELIAKIAHKRGKKAKTKKDDKQQQTKKEKKANIPQNVANAKTENKLNPQKLKDLQFNKEKAEAILKALQNQEMQYIQQQQQKKRQAQATPNDLPDW
jgi:hypothetical protein